MRVLLFALAACGASREPARSPGPGTPPTPSPDASISTTSPTAAAPTPAPAAHDVAPPGGGTFASLAGTGDIASGFDEADLAEYPDPPAPDPSTGWGRIGTGSYGQRSIVHLGLPAVPDGYDATALRTAIKQRFARIKTCYETPLAKAPDLSGEVAITFEISRDGTLRSVEATGLARVDACVAAELRRVRLPRHPATVPVSYRWTFSPVLAADRQR